MDSGVGGLLISIIDSGFGGLLISVMDSGVEGESSCTWELVNK
jgi:hypothetical protein